MKKVAGLLIASGILLIASCRSNISTSDTHITDVAGTMSTINSGAIHVNAVVYTPGDFAMTAISLGLMEVELAYLAQQRSSSIAVKDFAKMMEQDHTTAYNELTAIIKRKNVSLPAGMIAEHQMHVNALRASAGATFDKAYIDMMVKDHVKSIDMFISAADNMTDAELKSFAARTLPVLQKHLEMAKALQGTMKF